MILHELATNAFKYGALSKAEGTIRLSWTTERVDSQDFLVLNWCEEGGPIVSAPTRRGFGTHLVHFCAQAEGGSATFSFEPSGLHVRLRLPVAAEIGAASG